MDTPGLPGAFLDSCPLPPPTYSRKVKPPNAPLRWKFELVFQSRAPAGFFAHILGFFLSMFGVLISLSGVLIAIFYHPTSPSEDIVICINERRRQSQEAAELEKSISSSKSSSDDTSAHRSLSSGTIKPAYGRRVTFKSNGGVAKDDEVSSTEPRVVSPVPTTSPPKSLSVKLSLSRRSTAKTRRRRDSLSLEGGLARSGISLPSWRRSSVASMFSPSVPPTPIIDEEENPYFRCMSPCTEIRNPIRKSMKNVRDAMLRKSRPADIILPSCAANTDDETDHSTTSSSPGESASDQDIDATTASTPTTSVSNNGIPPIPEDVAPSQAQIQASVVRPRRLSILRGFKTPTSDQLPFRTTYAYGFKRTTAPDNAKGGPTASSPEAEAVSDQAPTTNHFSPRSVSISTACSSAREQAHEVLEGTSPAPRQSHLRRFSEANWNAATGLIASAGLTGRGRGGRSSLPNLPKSP